MKKLLSLFVPCVLFVASSPAATWNDQYGLGNNADDWLLSGSGVPFTVVQSVQSNSLYYITSAKASGAPRISSVWVKPDLTPGTLNWYTPTNTWTLASNATAGATTLWLTSTNSQMATNDLLVFQNVASDAYQLLIVSGNATDARGTVSTNALGQVQVKVFNAISNAVVAGDKLYKMALQQSITPLSSQNITNDTAVAWGNWWQLATRAAPIQYGGRIGVPSALVMTFSNAAGMTVQGDYYVRQRR
jgi:hypothetical protein